MEGMNASEEISQLKQEIESLRKEVELLRSRLHDGGQESRRSEVSQESHISPLAAECVFPEMPKIDGVKFSVASAEIKYAGRPDVMLASIEPGASIAGVFTQSSTRSAPVLDCESKLAKLVGVDVAEDGMSIFVNSGNANAFTGSVGVRAVKKVEEAVSNQLGVPAANIFTASTGVIGERLPHEKIVPVVSELVNGLGHNSMRKAAEAILTTDTFPKGAWSQTELDGTVVNIAGFAKGSGMIAPDMATMLAFLFTDAPIAQRVLQSMVSTTNERSFNSITVDGDTSTSDTVLVVASGKARCRTIENENSINAKAFLAALETVMVNLAKQIVVDGEGASKFVTVSVSGAGSDLDARRVARSIANSPLVKTAIAGEDPNWGRIVMAVGKSGAAADRDRLSISLGDILVAEKGKIAGSYREEAGAEHMKNDEIFIGVDLGIGSGSAKIWTCDLTHRYVSINADYRS